MKGIGHLAPSPIRLPPDLKDWLKHQAINNHRSMNSEVIARLEESRARQGRIQTNRPTME
ncbi:Arc family DNA-binding protein [Variovorax sp. R-27]|uniref:Arc family DNA-binding protein n=1 Tax=Variovorax sp. R-27 TaxID=3404058 RepID=UPI003CEE24E0